MTKYTSGGFQLRPTSIRRY